MLLIFKAFKANAVVPDVIEVAPSKELQIKYLQSNKELDLGNELAPKDVQEEPEVHYEANPNSYYTLAMVDPDAPRRRNPVFGEWQQWVVVNIPGEGVAKGDILSEYTGAVPPKVTGLHRYVFLVYEQPDKLSFDEPHQNSTSISGRAHFSINKFAYKYNMGNPIAGNFFQAQYDESVAEMQRKLFSASA